MPKCQKCGADLPEGAKFCTSCGNVVQNNPQPQNPQPQNPQPQYANPQNASSASFTPNPDQQRQGQYNNSGAAYYAPVPPAASVGQNDSNMAPVVSTGSFFGYGILFAIPLVGFIIQLVLAFGGSTNKNLRNYARAQLIWVIIGVVVSVLVIIFAVAAGISLSDLARKG